MDVIGQVSRHVVQYRHHAHRMRLAVWRGAMK